MALAGSSDVEGRRNVTLDDVCIALYAVWSSRVLVRRDVGTAANVEVVGEQ